jgi:hypothetical protein
MTLTPFDFPPPNADDPSPRIIRLAAARPQGGCDSPTARPANVRPIPADCLRAIFAPRTRRQIEARLNADAHIQTLRHRVVPDLTWRDDLADLWDDIRSQPLSHAVVAVVTVILWTALLLLPLVLS